LIVGVDTDVLVHWTIEEAGHHERVRNWLSSLLAAGGVSLGLAPQVWFEWMHVVTDRRRFESPLDVERAARLAEELTAAEEVVEILPSAQVLPRVLQLMRVHRLGRKRILDTALAVTLEQAGVGRLATFNGRDFQPFDFLEVVEPG
jgi:predicted nucleic acid-binding protein